MTVVRAEIIFRNIKNFTLVAKDIKENITHKRFFILDIEVMWLRIWYLVRSSVQVQYYF